jgi:type VI secretion system protein VasI
VKTLNLTMLISALLISSALHVAADEQQMIAKAKLCSQISQSRLERLACFDDVFATPLAKTKSLINQTITERIVKRPDFWQLVAAQEQQRRNEDVFVSSVNRDTTIEADASAQQNTGANVVLTQAAMGAIPPRPILTISCIDNITRLQIMLHQPIDEGVTPLTLVIDAQPLASRWFSEQNGYAIRAGRGLPGIEDIKAMLNHKTLVIRSKTPQLDNLSFELTNLVEDIKPLRQACHW